MQNPLNIVILAAGKGSRMYSALPKVLHPLAGKPMINHVLETACSLTPDQIIIVYGHEGEQVKAAIQNESIQWVEQAEQLGTGHALKMALPLLPKSGVTLVLYGDVPLINKDTLTRLLNVTSSDGVGLLTNHLDDPAGYGRILRKHNQIIGIVEEKDATIEQKQITEVNTGFMALPNVYLNQWLSSLQKNNAQNEYYLTDVIALAVKQGLNINSVQTNNQFEVAGVNNKQQLADLERIYQKKQAQELLQAGVTLIDPARFDLRGSLEHGQDITIDINTILSGTVKLGNQVMVGSHCILHNVTIADHVQIAPFSHLENCTVGANSQVGPFARIRPGTQLGKQTRIGNFVEIKNSHIGTGSKVNHLTYIGDSSIGEQCNIGAGTVTCNYDGANKFRTEIGNQVFVGSGTMLVAPVSLANNVTIGAGSVITKNCEENTLNLTRSPQKKIQNWFRPAKQKKD